jgi:hypothetical protein
VAAADPRGSFTAAATEAGCTDEESPTGGGVDLPALEAVTVDPGGSFTVVTTEAGCTDEEGAGVGVCV